jgi:uncharacterized protein
MLKSKMLVLTLLGASLAGAAEIRQGSMDAELLRAIRAGDAKTVRVMLKGGASAEARDANGATALMYAALYANAETMKMLLNAGADPAAANQAGATALMWAVQDEQKVRLLLDAGAPVDAQSKEGRTALMIAARQEGSAPVVRLLLSRGADATKKDALGGTALMMAAQAGDLEVLRMMADRGVEIDAQAEIPFAMPRFGREPEGFKKLPPEAKGVTALMLAAGAGSADCVRFLLERGADPRLKALGIITAMHPLAWRNEPEIARMLLAKGADVNAREMRGATPLIIAAASDDAGPEMIRVLLDAGADVHAKDAQGRTALDFARMRGATPVTRMLEAASAARQ